MNPGLMNYLIVCIDHQHLRGCFMEDLQTIKKNLSEAKDKVEIRTISNSEIIVMFKAPDISTMIFTYKVGTIYTLKGLDFLNYCGIADPYNLIEVYTQKDITKKKDAKILTQWLRLPWTRL